MFRIVIISVLVFNYIYSQEFIYPSLPSDVITDMLSISENEILFINNGGSIFKSYDNGKSWELKKHFQGMSLEKFYIVSDGTIFIKPSWEKNGEPIGIIFSFDKGESWDAQKISLNNATDVLPLSKNVILKSTINGDIQILDNFFNSWKTMYTAPTYTDSVGDVGTFTEPYGYVRSFELLPSGDILALGTNVNAASANILTDSLTFILNSSDGGYSWNQMWTGLTSFGNFFEFSDSKIGWLYAYRNLYKTTNGGKEWIIQDSSYFSQFYLNNIVALDSQNVFLFAIGNKIIKSINSGQSWDEIEIGFNVSGSNNLFITNDNDWYLFGHDFIKSFNLGKSWAEITSSFKSDIYDIDFISPIEGLALGNKGLYKSYDGGYSWELKFDPKGLYHNVTGNVHMINENHGWMVTNENIYKTEDKGESWTEVKLSTKPEKYNGVTFYGNHLGIIPDVAVKISNDADIFESKKHYLTSDGGNNWKELSIDSLSEAKYFSKIKFTDPEHLFALNRKALWVSNDTAKTFKKIFSLGNYFKGSIAFDFYDSLTGVFLNNSYIFITNDGGKTWKETIKNERLEPLDASIIGPNFFGEFSRLIEAGKHGKVRRYYFNNSGGITFRRDITSYTKKYFNKIGIFIENDFPHVWIAGNGFSILHRVYEKIPTGVEQNENTITDYYLFENYPNPFNPTTKIKYILTKPAFTNLDVFNILGENVANLVSEYQSSGKYEVDFDAFNLPSGIYIYRLQSGEFINSKKMVLLR